MLLKKFPLPAAIIVLSIFSCTEEREKVAGPIILGDSSMIVTETNAVYLTNFVEDIQLRTVQRDSAQAVSNLPKQETVAEAATEETSPIDDGVHIPFKEITVFIPNIKIRSFKKQDPSKSYSVTYQLAVGRLKGNHLRITGATISRVSQRYVTSITANTAQGTLLLESFNHLTEWTPLKGNGDSWAITGIDPTKLQHTNPTASTIKKAVSKAARNKRLSRAAIQRWEKSVRNVRSVNQKPFDIELRSVMWKIEGKDDHGKAFEKQVRMDLPV